MRDQDHFPVRTVASTLIFFSIGFPRNENPNRRFKSSDAISGRLRAQGCVTYHEELQHLSATTASECLTIPLSSLHIQSVQVVVLDKTKHPKLEMFL